LIGIWARVGEKLIPNLSLVRANLVWGFVGITFLLRNFGETLFLAFLGAQFGFSFFGCLNNYTMFRPWKVISA